MVQKELLEILACPFCKSPVTLDGERIRCTEAACGCIYAVKEGIPVMLIDEAERPCPGCGVQRTWEGTTLRCPDCGRCYDGSKREN